MIKVLVVDDSGFFRRRIGEMLSLDKSLEVVGFARDGQEAIEMTRQLRPDVITMDIEMPGMNGIEATRRIMMDHPTPIIMFSSLTTEGAQSTLDALDAGALDYLPKRFQDIAKDIEEARLLLCERVRTVAKTPVSRLQPGTPAAPKPAARPEPKPRAAAEPPVEVKPAVTAPKPAPVAPAPRMAPRARRQNDISIVAIGTSTGGPVALQNVLTKIPADFPLPILIVQHMPGTFTPTFAQRLDQQCAIRVKEAQDGDEIKPGLALLAPGGKQMLLKEAGGRLFVKVEAGEQSLTYKPSVDITFRSVSKIFPDKTLAIIMTGMGADGREGCRELKNHGSEVWAQNEQSCVVYGMPAAIVDAGLADEVMDVMQIGSRISERV